MEEGRKKKRIEIRMTKGSPKVVDIGPIQVTADKTKTLPLPPIVGGIALVGGIVLLVMGNKKG